MEHLLEVTGADVAAVPVGTLRLIGGGNSISVRQSTYKADRLTIQLPDDLDNVDLTGATIRLEFIRPDGTGSFSATLTPDADSIITYDMEAWCTEINGRGRFELSAYRDATGSELIWRSSQMIYQVDGAVDAVDAMPEPTEEWLAEVNQAIADAAEVKAAADAGDFNAGFGTPTATATGLDAGVSPTASVTASGDNAEKVFAFEFGVPKGDKGDKGDTGDAAGFGTPTATANTLSPGASATAAVSASGDATAKVFAFTFGIPSGLQGIQGERGYSAYEQAVTGGYTDTEAAFLADLAAIEGLAAELEALL